MDKQNAKLVKYYIDYLINSNLTLEDVEDYYYNDDPKAAVNVYEFIKKHSEILKALEYDCKHTIKSNYKNKNVYYLPKDKDEIIFGRFKVEDLAFEYSRVVVCSKRLIAIMNVLCSAADVMEYKIVITGASWPSARSAQVCDKDHLRGDAIDIKIENLTTDEVARFIENVLDESRMNYKISVAKEYVHLAANSSKLINTIKLKTNSCVRPPTK